MKVTCIGHMFKPWYLEDSVIAIPQSAAIYPGNSSNLIYIFQEGVIEQCHPPDHYGSFCCNYSKLCILELVNTLRTCSVLSLFDSGGLHQFQPQSVSAGKSEGFLG